MRVALVTCATLPDLDPDDQKLIEPLSRLDVEAVPAVWSDASVDWAAFDLAVIRNTWDYTDRRDSFVAWARSVPRLANPADIVEWNSDKRYLTDLARAGLPVVPTTWVSDDGSALPEAGMHVLKPAVGAGSVDAARFAMHDEHEARLARAHAERLLAAGQTVMVQPYMESIEGAGETGLIYVGGELSHAISKSAMLGGDRRASETGLYLEEKIVSRAPSAAEVELSRRALAAVPGGWERLLYARVDLVPDANGEPILIELELTEPSLFMSTTPGSEERFATAIARRARLASGSRT